MTRITAITLPTIVQPPEANVNESVRNSRHPMRETKAQNSIFLFIPVRSLSSCVVRSGSYSLLENQYLFIGSTARFLIAYVALYCPTILLYGILPYNLFLNLIYIKHHSYLFSYITRKTSFFCSHFGYYTDFFRIKSLLRKII
ncbi:hypothetical protein NIES3974_28190 [Calothrix sp. NIES-3974]|nr:hypothetical protein NIES3974_28190 [Calothrix sp. NIES-3974]